MGILLIMQILCTGLSITHTHTNTHKSEREYLAISSRRELDLPQRPHHSTEHASRRRSREKRRGEMGRWGEGGEEMGRGRTA